MTKVIFRTLKNGEVIAIFPQLLGDSNYYQSCYSYMHIGQHGSCHLDVIKETRLSMPSEYKSLLNELINLCGYNDLKTAFRCTYKDLQARRAEYNKHYRIA